MSTDYSLPAGKVYRLTEDFPPGTHPKHPDYPLYKGDLFHWTSGCGWTKVTGLGIFAFEFTPEQIATLEVIDTPRLEMVGLAEYLAGA